MTRQEESLSFDFVEAKNMSKTHARTLRTRESTFRFSIPESSRLDGRTVYIGSYLI